MQSVGSASVFHACWSASSWPSRMTKEGVGGEQLQDARSAPASQCKEQRRQPSQAKQRPHQRKAPTTHTRSFPAVQGSAPSTLLPRPPRSPVRVDHRGVS
jgi:hypothetical protein